MDKKKIADKLRALRVSRNATVTDVANAVGLTPQAITMYETGARVPRDEIKIKLANYFGVAIEDIFFD